MKSPKSKTKKVALLLCIASLFSVQLFATDVSGTISTNTVWTLTGSPYIVTGNILVNSGITLTIEPGVIVKFDSGLSMHIDGELLAQGAITDSITFTSNTADSAGAWGYIYFNDVSTDAVFENDIYGNYLSGSILEYCIIQYAGGVSIADNGALRFDQSTPYVNHCTITNNSASGIRAYQTSSSLKISNSLITKNASSENGGGIYIYNDQWDGIPTTCLISGNTVSYNSTTYPSNISTGGGIFIAVGNYKTIIVSNNIVTHNTADNGGGIYNAYHGTANFYNNVIINNTASINPGNIGDGGGGIYNQQAAGMVYENIIVNNTSYSNGGGVMLFQGSSPIVINNVIADNVTSGKTGGIYSWNSASPYIFHNHIIRNTAKSDVGIYNDNSFNDSLKFNTIAYNKNTDSTDIFNRTIYLSNAHPEIKNNNIFNNTAFYELYNENVQGSANVVATPNWWGTTIDAEIQTNIYDWFDVNTFGIVNYSPYFAEPDTIAPVSPPANVIKTNLGGGQVLIQWEHNPESDIEGYFLYYNGFTGYSFDDFIDVGNDTSYILAGVSIYDTIAVTAYDSAYSLANENLSTITNDNMTNGNESWFTYARTDCSTFTLDMSALDASCPSCSDGSAMATVSDGLAPYAYAWSTSPVQTNSTATGLLPGMYYVTVTDFNGCELIDSVQVHFATTIFDGTNPLHFSVFPNPCQDYFILNCSSHHTEISALNIYDAMGSLVKTINITDSPTPISTVDLCKGVYVVELKSNFYAARQKLVITK